MRYRIKKTRKYHDPGDPVRALEFQNRRSIVVPRIYCGDRRDSIFQPYFFPFSLVLLVTNSTCKVLKSAPSLFLSLSNNIYRE